MPRALRALLLFTLVACECGEKSDEERLRAQVDTTKVHLWVATKVAVTKAQSDDPTVQKARAQLMAALAALHAARTPDPTEPEAPALTASEAVDLAVALWDLRATGARIVREDSEDELDPVLPVLLAARGVDPVFSRRIDANTEHTLLMLGLFGFKLHPSSPTPVPIEILLYEAMHVDAEALSASDAAFPGLAEPSLATRSYLYAQAEYCDLAQRDAAALEASEAQRLSELMVALGGEPMLEEDSRRTAAALKGLAHGSTALCYLKRDDREKADEELQAFVANAEEAGAPPEDLAMIRAYLAYRQDDLAETRRQLALAKESSFVDDEERAEIDGLIAQLDRDETSGLDAAFDQAFFGATLLKVTWHELERAGVFESMADAPLFHGVRDFIRGATAGVTRASEAVGNAGAAAEESAGRAVSEGRSWLDGILGD